MPGAAAPHIDTWAPAQYFYGTSGGAGPLQSPDTASAMSPNSQATYDDQLHYKLAGTIVLALVTVFVLQKLGFRFVVATSFGAGS